MAFTFEKLIAYKKAISYVDQLLVATSRFPPDYTSE